MLTYTRPWLLKHPFGEAFYIEMDLNIDKVLLHAIAVIRPKHFSRIGLRLLSASHRYS